MHKVMKGIRMQKRTNRQEIMKNVSFYSGSTYIAQMLSFLRGFLNARILGPALYGVWSALNIVLSYRSYLHLGSLNAMNREIPYNNGKGLEDRANKAREVTFTFSFILSIVFSCILIIMAVVLRKKLLLIETIGLVAIAFIAFLYSFQEFYETALTALKRFDIVSKAKIIFPLISVILTLILVPRFKIYGVYLTAVLFVLLYSSYFYFKKPYKLKLCFDIREWFRLVRMGFPIMSVHFLQGNITNLGGILVLLLLGKTNMGYYSVAMLAGRFLMYFPNSITMTFEPYMFQKYGETHNILDIKKFLIKPALVMSFLFPVILAFYYTGVTFFIRYFLSEYVVAIYPFFIILIARFFISFSPTTFAFVTAINKQRRLIPIYIIGIAIMAASSLVLINNGFGILSIPIGLLLSFFFIGSAIFLYAMKHYVKSTIKCVSYLLTLYLPLFYTLLVILFINTVVINSSEVLLDVARLFIRFGMLCLFSLPVIYIAHKKTGILHDVAGIIRRKR